MLSLHCHKLPNKPFGRKIFESVQQHLCNYTISVKIYSPLIFKPRACVWSDFLFGNVFNRLTEFKAQRQLVDVFSIVAAMAQLLDIQLISQCSLPNRDLNLKVNLKVKSHKI